MIQIFDCLFRWYSIYVTLLTCCVFVWLKAVWMRRSFCFRFAWGSCPKSRFVIYVWSYCIHLANGVSRLWSTYLLMVSFFHLWYWDYAGTLAEGVPGLDLSASLVKPAARVFIARTPSAAAVRKPAAMKVPRPALVVSNVREWCIDTIHIIYRVLVVLYDPYNLWCCLQFLSYAWFSGCRLHAVLSRTTAIPTLPIIPTYVFVEQCLWFP